MPRNAALRPSTAAHPSDAIKTVPYKKNSSTRDVTRAGTEALVTSVVKLFFYGTVLIISASGEVPHIGPRNAALCAAPISASDYV